MSKRVIALQHVGCETIGAIADALAAGDVAVDVARVFAGEAIPAELGQAAGLIVMGGPMSVYEHDRHPHLIQEMRLIEKALTQGRPVLGICLGSQLLAAALGATVRASGGQEIGWGQVTLAPAAATDPLFAGLPESFMALHWHGDIFDLPSGAELLASSHQTAHQAFRCGASAYGLLFHLEGTGPGIDGMAKAFPDDLAKVGLTHERLLDETRVHLPQAAKIGAEVFRRWVGLLES